MSDAIKAVGTLLQKGDGAGSENFTTIAEVTDITGPNIKQDMDDVTSHSSAGGWREKVGTLLDGGQVTLAINYVPANATQNATLGLIADLKNRVKRNFKLIFPDSGSTTWSFAALVVDFKPKAAVASKLSADVTMEITGQPTLA